MTATVDTIILDTINALQVLNQSIAGMNAPQVADYPTSLDTQNLPFILTWPAEGDFWLKGGGWRQMDMTYRVIGYVQALGQDDFPSRTLAGVAALNKLINVYVNVANVALVTPPPPYQLTIASAPDGARHHHTGLDATPTWGGKQYVGFEIQVRIRAEWQSP